MKSLDSCLLGSLFAAILAMNGVLGGLEDAKHSTKLDHANFDDQISKPEVDCKSLQGTWDIVGRTFESDSKCRVAHLDANEASNRDLASRFSVTGFPTIKFLYKDTSKPALDYSGARTPEAFIKFLNAECGTHRASGGLLLPEAGRVAGLDTLVATFLGLPSGDRPNIIKQATEAASKAKDGLADYYVKVMVKINADETWPVKEAARLKKLAEKGATMSAAKFEELQMKQNILQVFVPVKEAVAAASEKLSDAAEAIKKGAQAVTGTAKDTAEPLIEKVTGEL